VATTFETELPFPATRRALKDRFARAMAAIVEPFAFSTFHGPTAPVVLGPAFSVQVQTCLGLTNGALPADLVICEHEPITAVGPVLLVLGRVAHIAWISLFFCP